MTRRMIAPLIFGLAGVAMLVGARGLAGAAAGLEDRDPRADRGAARRRAGGGAARARPRRRDQYRRVRATGAIEPGELHVYTSAPGRGVGYRVIVPFRLADGRRILLDRGFVPIAEKDAPRRLGPITVEGALLWPQETDRFTSAPDREKNIWFARDVAADGGRRSAPHPVDAGRRRRATIPRRRCRSRSP